MLHSKLLEVSLLLFIISLSFMIIISLSFISPEYLKSTHIIIIIITDLSCGDFITKKKLQDRNLKSHDPHSQVTWLTFSCFFLSVSSSLSCLRTIFWNCFPSFSWSTVGSSKTSGSVERKIWWKHKKKKMI